MIPLSSTAPESLPVQSHVNNFDFLRLLFATFVLITHSYPLSGLPEEDILFQITDGQASLSYLGVAGFFVISGYLITKSLVRSRDLRDYYFKRAIRLFPGLWVLIGVTVIVGFFLSGKTIIDYLSHRSTLEYLIFNSLLKTQYSIEGVFTTVPFTNFINGSLWSIPYEFFCYIVLSSLFYFRKNVTVMRAAILSAIAGGLVLQYFFQNQIMKVPSVPFFYLSFERILPNLLFFLGGGLWALFPLPSTKGKLAIAMVATGALMSTFLFDGLFTYAKFFLLPLLLIPFGELNFKSLSWIRKYGDFSYGIYLWGFFLQQVLMQFFHLDYLQLMALSIPLTYVAGALSWHLVEKKALRLKGRTIKITRPLAVPQ